MPPVRGGVQADDAHIENVIPVIQIACPVVIGITQSTWRHESGRDAMGELSREIDGTPG